MRIDYIVVEMAVVVAWCRNLAAESEMLAARMCFGLDSVRSRSLTVAVVMVARIVWTRAIAHRSGTGQV